ncbi:hypothetical protein BACPU_26340 [Bacillus pumilus]|nr:hypothetical protein BACPU_26340 [Bacillus pumilus]
MEFLDALTVNTALLVAVALLTETLTDIVKASLPDNKINGKITYFTSNLVGVLLAFAFNLNLFNLTGYGEYVSIVFAGLLASRGANYVNGFVKKFDILRK